MLKSYLPVLVFLGLGSVVGLAFTNLGRILGPRRPSVTKASPYECGLPSDVQRGFRFGISFYLVAMLFILFDVEAIDAGEQRRIALRIVRREMGVMTVAALLVFAFAVRAAQVSGKLF